MKEIFVIAGPNGAGKTTTAFTLLPEFIRVNEYVNADSLAHALSPFNPDAVAIQAGDYYKIANAKVIKLILSFYGYIR